MLFPAKEFGKLKRNGMPRHLTIENCTEDALLFVFGVHEGEIELKFGSVLANAQQPNNDKELKIVIRPITDVIGPENYKSYRVDVEKSIAEGKMNWNETVSTKMNSEFNDFSANSINQTDLEHFSRLST